MSKTLTQKIIENHFVSGSKTAGEEIAVKIDQTLTQDATGTMVYLQFEAMDIKRVKTELSVSYIDHNTLQSDFKNMDDHKFLQSFAKKYGLYFSRIGNGICHQVHLERFGIPGKILLGSDSHTPTGGGLGMLAIGAGGLDIACAMAGAPFTMSMPFVTGVKLTGRLGPMCSSKDVILKLLQIETVKGGVGRVYEYYGSGVETLSVPQRATITNMGAELGATTSIFPSDSITGEFFKLQKREKSWVEFKADEGCRYDRVIEINLSEIVPMIAQPDMPDKVVPVSDVEGIKIDQAAIGSCTNSSINDLGIASDILEGKTVAENVSLGISPGSKQVFESSLEAGIIKNLVKSGARILESACGPCIGMGFAPSSGGVSIRSFNRNFKGRSGTKDAKVYLSSPETAAASALFGVITDPRKVKLTPKDYTKFITIDDSMIIPPAPESDFDSLEIERGPNIKPCPKAQPAEAQFEAQVLIKTDDNITTDHIMPAGAKVLPFRSNVPEISKFTFEAVDPDFYENAKKAGKGIIVGGENYGQGSSREHAALAPMYLGIKAVIVKSFARIHKANLVNFGIMPLTFKNPSDYGQLSKNDIIYFPSFADDIKKGNLVKAVNKTTGKEIVFTHDLAKTAVEVLLAGGMLNYTRGKMV
ncbi:MAG: aconitate hydratase [Spirochaetia bacterium]|jgi:aconitate hydratase|nr:aconitate hydratase [Spirochaetia bacterium]